MKTLGETVRLWRESQALSPRELGEMVGIKKGNAARVSIENLEQGKVSRPRYLHTLAKVMGYAEVDDLLAGKPPPRVSHTPHTRPPNVKNSPELDPDPIYAGAVPFVTRVPVVGMAKLGENGWYDEISTATGHGDGYVEVYTKDPNAFSLKVRGDSMAPAIKDGWFVVIEPNGQIAPGEYVLVILVDGRKMVKELLYQRSDSISVVSVNGDTRMTLEIATVESLQAVAAIVPPSKWKTD